MNTNKYIGNRIGNYHIISQIASGGFASVFQAKHIHLTERIVAIKLLHNKFLSSKEEQNRFLQEAQLLEKLKHPHILSILDVGINEDLPYIVTEYAINGSLRDRLKQKTQRPLSQQDSLAILSQIGQALQHAHQQKIVHRDLKPENILFNSSGKALLADFGIATVLPTVTIQYSTTIIGSPRYMSPEQFKGIISKESDQYALGCIAYELFTGKMLFDNPDFFALGFKHANETPIAPRELNPQLPIHIELAILKAIAKQRADRYKDISTFIIALHKPTSAQKHPTSQKSKEQWVDAANAYFKDGHYEKALTALERAIQLAPDFATAYNRKGCVLQNLSRYGEALAAFERAVELEPNFADAYITKSYTLYNLKLYDEAFTAIERAIQLNPNSIDIHLIMGRMLCSLDRYSDALPILEKATQLDPKSAVIQNSKGHILYNLGRYEEALVVFKQATQLDSSFALAYLNKGNAFHRLHLYGEALAAYEQATQLNPNLADAWYNKGILLDTLGQQKEAQYARQIALQLGYKE